MKLRLRKVKLFVGFILIGLSSHVNAIDFDAMQPGHWYEIPNTTLEDAFPNPAPPGVIGPKGVVRAWNGGAFDASRERMILWGGGHNDYSGNEIYVFDINAAVPKWERLTEPSMNVGGDESSGVYPDGLPRSRHTYNYVEYIESIDEYCAFGASGTYPSSQISVSLMQCFNFQTHEWNSGVKQNVPTGNKRGFAIYDVAKGNVWYRPATQRGLYKYDAIEDQWSQKLGSSQNMKIYATPAIDTVRNQLVAVGNDQFLLWDLNNPGNATMPSRSGNATIEKTGAPGFQYDNKIDKFVGWQGGSDVYTLDPVTWNWVKESPAASNSVTPPAAIPTGTYGRFRYIVSKNVYMLYNDYNQNVYFYKLSAGSGSNIPGLPMINFTASAYQVSVGGSVTLNWLVASADACDATGNWAGSKAVNGSEIVSSITTNSTFTLNCSNSKGNVSRTIAVSIEEGLPTTVTGLKVLKK